MSLDEIGQTVSLRGRIVDRLHMEPRFSSERTGQSYSTHRGTWLGIPGNGTPLKRKGMDAGGWHRGRWAGLTLKPNGSGGGSNRGGSRD